MEIRFDYDFDNWNEIIYKSRSNYFYANASKKKEMKFIKYTLLEQKIKPIKDYPVEIVCYWYRKTKQGDLDNLSIKSILDQLQASNILKNDNLNCIQKITHIYMKGESNYLIMKILKI